LFSSGTFFAIWLLNVILQVFILTVWVFLWFLLFLVYKILPHSEKSSPVSVSGFIFYILGFFFFVHLKFILKNCIIPNRLFHLHLVNNSLFFYRVYNQDFQRKL
jgi:thiol:disulfide interchange protein